jgi:hypothetical protein
MIRLEMMNSHAPSQLSLEWANRTRVGRAAHHYTLSGRTGASLPFAW